MNCPECNNKPMTLSNFLIKGTSRVITCKSCGANLKASKRLRIGNVLLVSIITIALIIIVNPGDRLNYEISFGLGAIIILVLWFLIGLILWSIGSLVKSENDPRKKDE